MITITIAIFARLIPFSLTRIKIDVHATEITVILISDKLFLYTPTPNVNSPSLSLSRIIRSVRWSFRKFYSRKLLVHEESRFPALHGATNQGRRCFVAPRRFLSALLRLSPFDNFRADTAVPRRMQSPPSRGALGLIVRNKEKNDGVPTFRAASSRRSILVRSRRTKSSNERTNVYTFTGKPVRKSAFQKL